MHAKHAGVQLICSRKCSFSHQSVADRRLDPVCQFAYFFGCTRDNTAAAHKNVGTFRLLNHGYNVIQSFFCDSFGKWFNFFRCFRLVFAGCRRYILGNIHQYRARSSALCDRKRTAQRICKNGDIFYNHTVFCDRHCDTRNVNLLKAVFSKQCLSYVAGNRYHRCRIHVGGCNSGDKIRCARAACSHADACFSSSTRISVRRMRSTLLV